MDAEPGRGLKLEIAHVLFIDIVGYSKCATDEQSELLEQLNDAVRRSEEVRIAQSAGDLIELPTGDGMALVFRTSPEAPARAAVQIAEGTKNIPELQLRMGIHSGPVNSVVDVSGRPNIAGAGINIAQRVMDCGDAGHILLSHRAAEDLRQHRRWQPLLHDLGECEVKHGVRISVVNFFSDEFGNAATPERLVRQTPTPPGSSFASLKWPLLAAAAGILIAMAFFFLPKKETTSKVIDKSIAVLPFESLSEDKANAYFADGVQDEILTRLSKIADLKVISRTSTQKYKSAPANLREIAQQLGVASILEGSVQKTSDQVRVSVQLINALTDSHLWAETYDRKLIDVFQVESDVAQRIATSLEARLTGREKQDLNATAGTSNPEAYDAYLHALALENHEGAEEVEKVIGYCRRAVELDPSYSQAWALLAIFESQKYFFPDHSREQLARAQEAAETARRLAPDSAHGPAAVGVFYYYCLGDYGRALTELKLAHERAPNSANILLSIALVNRRQGRVDQSITLLQQASRLDPLNQDTWVNLARSLRGQRKMEEARAMYDRALTISPDDIEVIGQKAETYAAEGDIETAWKMIKDLKIPPSSRGVGAYISLLVYQRRFDDAIAYLSSFLVREKEVPRPFIAVAHGIMGELFHVKNDEAKAQPLFLQAEEELKAIRAEGDAGLLVADALLEVEARLGKRKEVEQLAQANLQTAGNDQWALPREEENVARAYTILGDFDRALPLLQHVLSVPSAEALTPAYLRVDPHWDPVRNDPRFQKLAEQKL